MSWTFRVLTCDEHATCTVVDCVDDDGWVASRSHESALLDPAVRLNLDYPEAVDHRGDGPGSAKAAAPTKIGWRMPSTAEARFMGHDPEGHRRLAFEGIVRSLEPSHPLTLPPAAIAAAVSATPAALLDEAEAKGWDTEDDPTKPSPPKRRAKLTVAQGRHYLKG